MLDNSFVEDQRACRLGEGCAEKDHLQRIEYRIAEQGLREGWVLERDHQLSTTHEA